MQQEQRRIDKLILLTKTLPGSTQGFLCFHVICPLKAVLYIMILFFFFFCINTYLEWKKLFQNAYNPHLNRIRQNFFLKKVNDQSVSL